MHMVVAALVIVVIVSEYPQVDPFNFHMCWTQGKTDKLTYLKKTKMWYLEDKTCSLDDLQPKKGNWPMREKLQVTDSVSLMLL